MSLVSFLRRLIPLKWQRTRRGRPISIILLLREPHIYTADELTAAAERAWNRSFSGTEKSSKHCVVQVGKITMMKAGPHALSFFHYPRPYIDNPGEQVDWLPQASQREAWLQHSACVGVDYINGGVSVELAYCVLSQLIAEMLDGNCTAIYIPRQESLVPNDSSLYLELHKLASACDSGVNDSPQLLTMR